MAVIEQLSLAALLLLRRRRRQNSIRFFSFSKLLMTLALAIFSVKTSKNDAITERDFIGYNSKSGLARCSCCPHTMRNWPCEAKIIKHDRFLSHDLARRNSHQNFAAHLRNKLSKLPREAKSSDVYLKCAPAFRLP